MICEFNRKNRMLSPITTCRKFSEIGTLDELARQLIEANPLIQWIKPRSLSAKIGELDKGKITWWMNNSDKADALANLLELSLAELGLQKKPKSNFFKFDEFPELPQLDLKKESLFHTGAFSSYQFSEASNSLPAESLNLDEWLESSSSFRAPYDISWLKIDDELQRSLFSKWLDVNAKYNVIFVDTLLDAGEELKAFKPLILCVSNNGGENDLTALADRPDGFGTLIVAPYMIKISPKSDGIGIPSWEYITLNASQKRLQKFIDGGFYRTDIKKHIWRPYPNWKIILLNWVAARVKAKELDTLFTAEEVIAWITNFDSSETWFKETKAIMLLCNIAHTIGERKLPQPGDLEAGYKLAQAIFKKDNQAQLFAIKKLAESRWSNNQVTWQGGLSLDTWATLSPFNSMVTKQEELNKIVNGISENDRKKAAESYMHKYAANTVDNLLSNNVITDDLSGSFDFQNRTLANLMVRDFILQKISNSDLSWAWAFFDNGRMPIVNASIDAAPIESLISIAKKLNQETVETVETIGASEALFIALGKRIANKQIVQPDLNLISLANKIIDRLALFDEDGVSNWDLPAPLSRQLSSQTEMLEWVNACWAWSLVAGVYLKKSPHWLFPGCFENLPLEAPIWLSSLWPDKDCEYLAKEWKAFFSITDQLTNDWDEPKANAMQHFHLSLLSKAAAGRWKSDVAWWQTIMDLDCKWGRVELFDRLKKNNDAAALNLWPSYLSYEINHSKLGLIHSQVRVWILERLSPSDALNSITEKDWLYLSRIPNTLPPNYRAPLLQKLIEDSKINTVDLGQMLNRFGTSVVPYLVDLLDNDNLLWFPAGYLWKWKPEETVSLLNQLNMSAAAKRKIIEGCPKEHLASVAKILIENQDLLVQKERTAWAKSRLASSGSAASDLLKLINNR